MQVKFKNCIGYIISSDYWKDFIKISKEKDIVTLKKFVTVKEIFNQIKNLKYIFIYFDIICCLYNISCF